MFVGLFVYIFILNKQFIYSEDYIFSNPLGVAIGYTGVKLIHLRGIMLLSVNITIMNNASSLYPLY